MNAFFWRNEAELMKIDHLKAAPCVTTLAITKAIASGILILTAIATSCFTRADFGHFLFYFVISEVKLTE